MLAPPIAAPACGPAHVMAAGLALGAAGFGVLTQVDAASASRPRHRLGRLLARARRRSFTLATDLIVGSAPPERAGAGLGDLGDELGARRRARHRGPRQHRHRGLPVAMAEAALPAGPPGGRGRAGHARRRRWRRRSGCRRARRGGARPPRATRSPRRSSSPPSSAPPLLAATALLAAVLLRRVRGVRRSPSRPERGVVEPAGDHWPRIARKDSPQMPLTGSRAGSSPAARLFPPTPRSSPCSSPDPPSGGRREGVRALPSTRRRAAVLDTVSRRGGCSRPAPRHRPRAAGRRRRRGPRDPARPDRGHARADPRRAVRRRLPAGGEHAAALAAAVDGRAARRRCFHRSPSRRSATHYAIRDGHHRVSVARARGAATIDASLA